LDFDVSSPGWFPDGEIPDGFVISDGMIKIKEYVVTLPKNRRAYLYQDGIEGKVVGTVHGYNYQNDQSFIRLDFHSERKLVRAPAAGRIESAILGDLPAMYWAEKTNTDIALGALNSKGDLHFRLSEKNAYLIPRLNDPIARLKRSGSVARIVSQYLDGMPNNDRLANQTANKLLTDDNSEEHIHPAN
jgi:ABC-type amino acid transport substrate-binding protein